MQVKTYREAGIYNKLHFKAKTKTFGASIGNTFVCMEMVFTLYLPTGKYLILHTLNYFIECSKAYVNQILKLSIFSSNAWLLDITFLTILLQEYC